MILSSAVLLAGCGGLTGGSGGTTLAVATVSPLSGGQSSLGSAIKNGAQMAYDERKDALKAAGYNVEFRPQDDEAKEDIGAQIAQRLASDKSYIGVVGTLNTGVAKGIAPVLKDQGGGLVMISPANTGVIMTESGWDNYNRIVFRDDDQGPAAARYAYQVLQAKTVYVMNDKTEYGIGLAEEFAKEFKAQGGTVIAEVGVEQAKPDYGPEATQATAKKADMIYFGGIYDTAGPLFKQIRAKGFTGMFMGGDGLDSNTLIELAGDAANNTFFTSVSADYSSGKGKEFFDKYVKQFNQEPPAYALYGYDAMSLLLDKLIEYGKANGGKAPGRAEFAKMIRETKDYPAISSTISFDSKGDNPNSKVWVFKVDGGKAAPHGPAPQK